jgi:lactoylglutathione lyase
MATELFPIIATTDLERSLAFYRDLLGGSVAYEFAGPDGKPSYVGVNLGSSHIGIGRDAAASAGGRTVSLWVYAEDCDALVGRLRSAGVTILEEPVDQPWGERVARVEDPDGIHVHVATHPAELGRSRS